MSTSMSRRPLYPNGRPDTQFEHMFTSDPIGPEPTRYKKRLIAQGKMFQRLHAKEQQTKRDKQYITDINIPDSSKPNNFAELHRQSRRNRGEGLGTREETRALFSSMQPEHPTSPFSFLQRLWILCFKVFETGLTACEEIETSADSFEKGYEDNNSYDESLSAHLARFLSHYARYIINSFLYIMLYPLDQRAAFDRFNI